MLRPGNAQFRSTVDPRVSARVLTAVMITWAYRWLLASPVHSKNEACFPVLDDGEVYVHHLPAVPRTTAAVAVVHERLNGLCLCEHRN
jgi:hypothetical protein